MLSSISCLSGLSCVGLQKKPIWRCHSTVGVNWTPLDGTEVSEMVETSGKGYSLFVLYFILLVVLHFTWPPMLFSNYSSRHLVQWSVLQGIKPKLASSWMFLNKPPYYWKREITFARNLTTSWTIEPKVLQSVFIFPFCFLSGTCSSLLSWTVEIA